MDLFIAYNHLGESVASCDITDRPGNFEKLIGFGLDPFIYRLRWKNENEAEVYEFWWGTTPFYIKRLGLDINPNTIITSAIIKNNLHKNQKLSKGCVASSSHIYLNRMI